MFNADYAEMYAEMEVGKVVHLDNHFSVDMGDMNVSIHPNDQMTIVCGHKDNADLEPGYRLWCVSLERDECVYQCWFRAHKLGLEA